MRDYIVVRVGSNSANQPMTPHMDIGVVQASSPAVALHRANIEFGHELYNNQHLRVIAAGRVSADRWNLLLEDLANPYR